MGSLAYGGAYLVFALACGLGAGIIARGKGNSFWLWFAIALCLPLLGNVAAALYRNENDEPRRQCPSCGNVVKAYDAMCMRCGTDLPYPAEGEMLPSVNELRAMREHERRRIAAEHRAEQAADGDGGAEH